MTPLVRYVAVKRGWMAMPSKERWHQKPTALMGGIAIYIAISIPVLYLSDFSSVLNYFKVAADEIPKTPSIAAVVWMGITFLFILGLLDDFLHIKPHTKLLGQILVALMVTFLGFRLTWFHSLTIDTIVTIFWIVGITNAFNLIDNMDGLCAGIGMVSSIYLSILFTSVSPEAALLSTALAGALAAFLIFNFNPASIFMGDSGSLVIGFTIAVLALYFPEISAANKISTYAVPVMLLMVPILDTTMVTLIRILSGRKASVGGKDHTSHRLVLMGMSEKSAVLFLYGTGIVSGLAAVFVSKSDSLTSPIVIVPFLVSIILMGIYLSQIRVYPEKEFSVLRDKSYTPILLELTYKRQILMIVLDFCLVAFAYYLAYRLRFDAKTFSRFFEIFLRSLPAVIGCKFVAFFVTGVYRGIWGYTSTNDSITFMKASSIASILSVTAVTFIYRFEDFSKGIFLIDWLLTTGFLFATRFSFRFFKESMKRKTLTGETVLIYGAGRGGELLLREILNNKTIKFKPLGFIDDNPMKIGKKLQGYNVLGTFNDIDKIKSKYPIKGILVSFNYNKRADKFHDLIQFCQEKGLFLKQFVITLDDIDSKIQTD
jgi:UDP-GlcNAc:undecaprenyl-phosphate GlcNAc-1-phosphate transferase